MEHWSRGDANAPFAAEYVPERGMFEHEITIIERNDDIWDQLLLRATGLAATILYTRGVNDTLSMNMTGGVLTEAPGDIPDTGKVMRTLRYLPGDFQLVAVDSTPSY